MASVETVRGPVDLGQLGQTLMHEHVFVLSTEHVQNYGSSWWDEEARVADAIEKLNALLGGCHTALTCLSRRPAPLPLPGAACRARQPGKPAAGPVTRLRPGYSSP